MKDLTKIYIDLSKCTEDQRKSLPHILEKAGQEIYFLAKPTLLSGKLDMYYPYLVFSRPSSNVWVFSHDKPDRTEILYPDFIKLFEGGKESGIKMTFGITDKNMEVISKQISRFEGAEFDRLSWEKIATEIGWDLPTIILWYFRKKESKNKWIKIESEADLPKESYNYWVMQSDGLVQTLKEYEQNKRYWKITATHYQPIIKPLPPKF